MSETPATIRSRSSSPSSDEHDGHRSFRKRRKLIKWTPDEDRRLAHLVELHGQRQWAVVASGMPGRTGKQVSLLHIPPYVM